MVRAEVVGGVAMIGASPRTTPPLVASTRLGFKYACGIQAASRGDAHSAPGTATGPAGLGAFTVGGVHGWGLGPGGPLSQ